VGFERAIALEVIETARHQPMKDLVFNESWTIFEEVSSSREMNGELSSIAPHKT
jgi:hypothetical protein